MTHAPRPIFPTATYRLAWAFDDPAAVTGSEKERRQMFRPVRDEIDARVQAWVAERA